MKSAAVATSPLRQIAYGGLRQDRMPQDAVERSAGPWWPKDPKKPQIPCPIIGEADTYSTGKACKRLVL